MIIPKIIALNFPAYAKISSATVTFNDMGEKSISAQVKIEGMVSPDFSYDWEAEFLGEKYIHPLRKPQASKENTSAYSTIDMTFQHWAVYQLKRYYFVELYSLGSGTAIADKYVSSMSLNLGDFVEAFKNVLDYYYGETITMQLNPAWQYAETKTFVEISYSYIWDLLQKIYELYAVRWTLEPDPNDKAKYIIKVGYGSPEVSHVFKYGFEGGLLRLERQVQDENIRNVILGRGGEKNLPYRYFKDVDKDNPSFPADPDWIPELRNIYFSELRPKVFRDYVRGWKTNPNRQLAEIDGTPITPYGSDTPIAVEPYDAEYAATNWAYKLGHEDVKFNPVEYVKADGYQIGDGVYRKELDSISKYGELWGALDNNEDIYPTIQGINPADDNPDVGFVDEAVAVEEVESDDVEAKAKAESVEQTLDDARLTLAIGGKEGVDFPVKVEEFEIEEGFVGNLTYGKWDVSARSVDGGIVDESVLVPVSTGIKVYDLATLQEKIATSIPAGKYRAIINFYVENPSDSELSATVEVSGIKVTKSNIENPVAEWSDTFNLWVKNIWMTEKGADENGLQYAERVWKPILGDRAGNEAKVVFSTGMLSTSEDYEFIIKRIPIYDTEKTYTDSEGNTYVSHWRIPLLKSDADLESTGLYVPSTKRQGKPGDRFFFTGIDMPHQYVLWAEEAVDAAKYEQLEKVREIDPTWVVSLDKVRMVSLHEERTETLLPQLSVGAKIRVADARFIIDSPYEELYLQTMTFTYNAPTESNPAVIPDVEITLSNEIAAVSNPVSELQGEVSYLSRQIGSLSNVEQAVRVIGDKLYLRKDGIEDISSSPTKFMSKITSEDFRQGMIGGAGWGIFRDGYGRTIIEADKMRVRQDFEVNNFVINQITVMGGKEIECAAVIECSDVEQRADYHFICYFDQKEGSVQNLFQVGDVAFCERFYPDNKQLKYYKRKVLETGENYIVLAGTTRIDGVVAAVSSGNPEKNDIICHFGNYDNPDRRYVKVRDVIGGGYERFLEGLESVVSPGVEYFFAGRQDGEKPRFFIGDKARQYMEWANGELNIYGKLNVKSTVDDKPITDFILDVSNPIGINYAIGTFDKIENKGLPPSMLELYETRGLAASSTVTVSFDIELNNITFLAYPNQGYMQIVFGEKFGSIAASDTFTASGHYSKTITMPGTITKDTSGFSYLKSVGVGANANASISISNFKVETGSKETAWTYSPYDPGVLKAQIDSLNYLKAALEQDTEIEGGLIQAALVRLGYKTSDGFVPQSGINGIPIGTDGRALAFWAGGDAIDKELDPDNGATYAVRMDGTGYWANNKIKIDKEKIKIGDSLVLSENSVEIQDEKGLPAVSINNEAVEGYAPEIDANTATITDAIETQTGSGTIAGGAINTPFTNPIFTKAYGSSSFNRSVSLSGRVYLGHSANAAIDISNCFYVNVIRKKNNGTQISSAVYNLPSTHAGDYTTLEFTQTWEQAQDEGFGIEIQVWTTNTSSNDASVKFSLYGTVTIAYKNKYANRTLIGVNGLQAFQSNGFLLKNDTQFACLFGNYGIKVDEDGVYFTKEGGQKWLKMDFAIATTTGLLKSQQATTSE